MNDKGIEDLRAAIAALEGQRATLGDAVLELATASFELGDACAALGWHAQSKAAFDAIGLSFKVVESRASIALCQARLGEEGPAVSEVEQVLAYLEGSPKDDPGAYIDVRWTCQRVLAVVGDARALPMLEALFADVRTCAAELAAAAEFTDPADRERLIQALPVFRQIAAAHGRPREPAAAG